MTTVSIPRAIAATTRLQADLDWLVKSCKKVRRSESWKYVDLKDANCEIPDRPGVYCVALPLAALPKNRSLILHGRTFGKKGARRQLQVQFYYLTKTLPGTKKRVVYVGKAASIRRRIGWHMSVSPTATTNQVLRGLVGVAHTKVTKEALIKARRKLERHGAICYLEHFHKDEAEGFSGKKQIGECHVAERDLLEIKLIAAYAPPFNIKAER